MFVYHIAVVLAIFILKDVSAVVLENFLSEAAPCETQCKQNFSAAVPESVKACSEGCRLYMIIGLAKDLHNNNKTVDLCEGACLEAFQNTSVTSACNYGCRAFTPTDSKEDIQTLHLLTPLMYMKSAYNSVAHHVKQFISTSWTVYVQDDSENMVVLQSSPKIVETLEYAVSRGDEGKNVQSYQHTVQEPKSDWRDCIPLQSSVSPWVLLITFFFFLMLLLWLCFLTMFNEPKEYLISHKKTTTKGYYLLCEPDNEIKAPLLRVDSEEENGPFGDH